MAYGTVNADVIQSSVSGVSLGAGNASIMKNRIINGAMVIDQRNAGASVTLSTTTTYSVDRFYFQQTQASKYSFQQNAGSVTPPSGFANYLGITSLSAYTVGSTDYFNLGQNIEGYNVADLGWGTANAKTVTLSFWVRSSLTGTFGVAFRNGNADRNYQGSYTISSANTWEQKTITVAGDTTGTWTATNGVGLRLTFGLGVGSTYSTSGGAWGAGNLFGLTGAVSVVGTNGATFYITGVQLEVGSSATGFEYRQYQQELALCQRYFQTITQGSGQTIGFFVDFSTTGLICNYNLGVSMRTIPSYVATVTSYRQNGRLVDANSTNTPTLTKASLNTGRLDLDGFSGLTSGDSGVLITNSTGYTALNAEL